MSAARREVPHRQLAYSAMGAAIALGVGAIQWAVLATSDAHIVAWVAWWVAVAMLTAAAGFVLGAREVRLHDASFIDPLTSLANRRYALLRLDQELARSRRYGGHLALLTVDIDGLKSINDRHGHLMGDAALRWVADCLVKNSRSSDIPSRFGGDEFVVLAPRTSLARAQELAERIRQSICAYEARQGRQTLDVSVSIGVAGLMPTAATTSEELLELSDQRMYFAKSKGGNRVTVEICPGDHEPATSGNEQSRRRLTRRGVSLLA